MPVKTFETGGSWALRQDINEWLEEQGDGIDILFEGYSTHAESKPEFDGVLVGSYSYLVRYREKRPVEHDTGEHAVIVPEGGLEQRLRETASYAIDPAFKARIREELLQAFRESQR